MRKVSILSLLLIVGLVVVSSSAVVLARGGQGPGQGPGGQGVNPPGHSKDASDSGTNELLFGVNSYIKLTVENPVTALGSVAGDIDEKVFANVNTLDVESNYSEGFVVNSEVTSSNYNGDHLEIRLDKDSEGGWNGKYEAWKRSEKDIRISYKLKNIGELDAGDYSATVTFTASTK